MKTEFTVRTAVRMSVRISDLISRKEIEASDRDALREQMNAMQLRYAHQFNIAEVDYAAMLMDFDNLRESCAALRERVLASGEEILDVVKTVGRRSLPFSFNRSTAVWRKTDAETLAEITNIEAFIEKGSAICREKLAEP